MAKNKNRDRKIQTGSTAERSAQGARTSSMEAQVEQRDTRVNPAGTSHKGRSKRFGHN
ncbi:hypothetical protein [Streptomyces formicae]|uniref:Uncharacterized protein n=1 Tax=Streptomyces formicae TaxID=1616117 RepID=A0ABY3WPK6_9ACTN|nr:hypothetical protein [Streptomyces formicae]UNM14537.1 hypothetical protein J4032_26480 [Streptomyces formicae]